MGKTLIQFERFMFKADALDMAHLFDEHQIPFEWKQSAKQFDLDANLGDTNLEYELWINPNDFIKAREIQAELVKPLLDDVPEGYYLNAFSTEELEKLLLEADQWSVFDVELAKKYLAERGKLSSANQLSELQESRMQEISKGYSLKGSQLLIAYVLSLSFVLAYFIGTVALALQLLSPLIGWYYTFSKRTLLTGERVWLYDEKSRKQGKICFVFSLSMTILSIGGLLIFMLFLPAFYWG